MPRQRLPIQYFADILGELKDANAKLDQLISRQAPAEVSEPAGGEPERVRLEEPVRPSLESSLDELKAAAVVAAESPRDVVSEAADQVGSCLATTKRGNTCGRPLPCPISAHG